MTEQQRRDALAILSEVQGYFDQRADAEYLYDGPQANEEMKLLIGVADVISLLEK